MIFTEEELRQAWRNGSGELPEFPPGTRFTPAALDFLSALGRRPGQTDKQAENPRSSPVTSTGPVSTVAGTVSGGELVLQPLPDGTRLVITTCDLEDILAATPVRIVVFPGVTVTDAAREILGKAGIKVTAAPANPANPPGSANPAATSNQDTGARSGVAGGLSVDKQELLAAARAGVLQRLGERADPALVDAVLQKIITAL
ncbi:MAG: hypothetical protein RBT68_05565 [Spirochaetia bacterium]|jgi:hypothetical protein|nr:hypothetical protein [Spirochaetia bacterium]